MVTRSVRNCSELFSKLSRNIYFFKLIFPTRNAPLRDYNVTYRSHYWTRIDNLDVFNDCNIRSIIIKTNEFFFQEGRFRGYN